MGSYSAHSSPLHLQCTDPGTRRLFAFVLRPATPRCLQSDPRWEELSGGVLSQSFGGQNEDVLIACCAASYDLNEVFVAGVIWELEHCTGELVRLDSKLYPRAVGSRAAPQPAGGSSTPPDPATSAAQQEPVPPAALPFLITPEMVQQALSAALLQGSSGGGA